MGSNWAAILVFAAWVVTAQGETKYIRLRNELITTTESPFGPSALQAQSIETRASGLYLIQFKGHWQASWLGILQAAQVKLLCYVPEDAFVVRLSETRLSAVRALPFVQWLGEYRPALKLHSMVRASLKNVPVRQVRGVKILLSTDTTASSVAQLGRTLDRLDRSTRLRFGTVMEGQATAAQVDALLQSPYVLWMEPASPPKLNDEVASKIVGGPNPIGGNPTGVQELGFDGRGVVVAVADSGLNNGDTATMHPDLAGRVDAFFYYGLLADAADEHSHGTHVTGIVAGNGATGETDVNGHLYGLGVASGTHIVAQRIFDGEGNYEAPPSYEVLTHDAVRAGAVIGSNSWGDDTQGRYDLSAAEFDALVRDADTDTPGEQPYVLEFSAGNAGPGSQTIGSPAVAKNVIATGASENDREDLYIYTDGPETMADFSSRGPCEDGRIKPDVVAPGTWIASLQSASATADSAWMAISDNYQYQGGTSQAGPHVSGAAAVFVQFYRETHDNRTPSPALVKAALINSAHDLVGAGGTDAVPNNDEGWGRVDLTQLIGTTRRILYLDQTTALTNQQVYEQRIVAASPHEPLKITLVYTDVPGFPAAIPALVNDLDLEVVGPQGQLYHGNQFQNGDSVANPDGRDTLNNVEAVHLSAPEPGEYVIRVRAQNVAEDIHNRTNQVPQQDFALVISGDVPFPGVGTLLLDKGAYNASSPIQIKLIDFDMVGQSSVSVKIASTTETNGETVTLTASPTAGVFTGKIAVAIGPATRDGRLQLASGDTITATYQDAAPNGVRTATAIVDLAPPVISGISFTNVYGQIVISWTTDERAASLVRFGTDPTLTGSLGNQRMTTDHLVTLPHAAEGLTNYFMLVCVDEAGNATTNDNQGQLYQIVSVSVAPVLVVDAFGDSLYNELNLNIPLSNWTDPLDMAGIHYEVWSVPDRGRAPTLEELTPFRVVLWRVDELSIPLATDVRAIRDYVAQGGGLFMASMEFLSRLDEGGFINFRKNTLHVDSFDVDPTVDGIYGVNNLSMTSGIGTPLDYGPYTIPYAPDWVWNYSDTFQPTTNAAPILYDNASGKPVGVRYPKPGEDSKGRVVFLSFPLETVPMTGDYPNNRVDLLQNIIGFLAPGVNGIGTLELDRSGYGIPARVMVEVADSDLSGVGQIAVSMYVSRLAARHEITLLETAIPGQFRGYFTLISESTSPLPDQIQVRDGDEIRVEYSDISTARTLRVAAVVDLAPPIITGILAEPEYSEAAIAWTTSEPADGLVQFGESRFLGRTAYAGELTDTHLIQLSGLIPDRDYYYQVASRDNAGNSVVDNNQGRLFTFHTLKPVNAPFVDNFEDAGTNWVAMTASQDAELSSILRSAVWELGWPTNSLATEAHSGTNVWGTNLRGEVNDYASADLISPAINLTGGNRATLRFWQDYDFTPKDEENDIYEYGILSVTTNNGALWTSLATYESTTGAWEETAVDLTPYLGHLIRLGWSYSLLSMATAVHPGWLVDDVSVEVSNEVLGTIIVTNNLAQSKFVIEGPLTTNGYGYGLVWSNLPLGDYVIRWESVPFYHTPPATTNWLDSTNAVVCQGNYTFTDANQNGISDEWEQYYFLTVDPLYKGTNDTDGDGMSDRLEFFAGTNPTNAASCLILSPPILQANRTIHFQWTANPGHAYRIALSTDLKQWSSAALWTVMPQSNAVLTLPPLNGSDRFFFRLESKP